MAERCVHTGGEWGCPNCLTERYEMAEAERDRLREGIKELVRRVPVDSTGFPLWREDAEALARSYLTTPQPKERVTIGNACGVQMASGTFCWKPKNHTGPHGRSRTK